MRLTLSLLAMFLLVASCDGRGSGSRGGAGDGDGDGTDEPSTPDNPNGSTTFESDLPGTDGSGGADAGVSDGDGAEEEPGAAPGDDDGAERAIQEADVVQVVGSRLYTLSRAAGLGIIDLTNPRKLRLLGSARDLPGEPFEMYVRDSVVIAMYSSWGQYVEVEDGYRWVQTSKVVALDVANPAAIKRLGSFDVPGAVSDSRIVGDVLYVVGYQDGYCWGCEQQKPLTAVLSLDVGDPRAMRKVDELRYEDVDNQWGWSRRSITVTTQRMYVAGPEWGQSEGMGSTIEVVDISDPSGDMVPGATLEAEGQISSRWQMDEHEGVLRVISQPPSWALDLPPVVQTFTVTSSSDITPLGRLPLVLPRPEQLQSVRFDGPRAYAVTFERTDPLFTIDLSDPAAPAQKGELEMPGFLYHMQPRGDRLIGLGFDQGNAAGAITVSVFDVSDLAQPTMLDRVNFGGSWASLPEDQDRIHKAFRILDELDLILVPFSGWSDSETGCWGRYDSGVQLVDIAGDDLTLRGAAPSIGQARRALVYGQNLVTFSDERVRAYDIADRAAPAQIGELVLARNVNFALPLANGTVARVTRDWWVDQTFVDFVRAEHVELAGESLGQFDLGPSLDANYCNGYAWLREVFVRGNRVELLYQRVSYDDDWDYKAWTGVVVVDATRPEAPRLAGKLEWLTDSWGWYYGYGYGYGGLSAPQVRTDSALVTLEATHDYNGYPDLLRARVIDMRDPANLAQTSLELARGEAVSTYSGLAVAGDAVLTSHHEPGSQGRVRFYFDRIDVSDPALPRRLGSINVPGSLLHYDPARDVMLTQEFRRVSLGNVASEECYRRFAWAYYDWEHESEGVARCDGFVQRVNLVRLGSESAQLVDTVELGERDQISSLSVGSDRAFATLGRSSYYYYGDVADCWDCGGYASLEPAQLLVLGGFGGTQLQVGRIEVENQRDPWWGWWGNPPVHASGTRALMVSNNQAAVLDASDVGALRIVREHTLHGWLQHVHVADGQALLSLSTAGVQRIDMRQ
jgi:hypothetical protein